MESKDDLKLTNGEAMSLLQIYDKVIKSDFDNFDTALKIADDAIKVEEAVKSYTKLKKALQDKVTTKTTQQELNKINKDLLELNSKQVVIKEGLNKIPTNILIITIKKPVDILLLRKLNLY